MADRIEPLFSKRLTDNKTLVPDSGLHREKPPDDLQKSGYRLN
jgi:hypothetical protein